MTATSLVAVFREQVDLRRIFLDDPARHEKGQPQLRGALPRSPAVCSRLTAGERWIRTYGSPTRPQRRRARIRSLFDADPVEV